jgi:hypothetical protein
LTLVGAATIFDLYKQQLSISKNHQIDFAPSGTPILSNNLVTPLLQIGGRGLFGLAANLGAGQ